MTTKERKHYETFRDTTAVTLVLFYLVGSWIGYNQRAISLDAILLLVSLVINAIACYYWVHYKSRSPWFWSLFIFGLLGWIVLAALKDKTIVFDSETNFESVVFQKKQQIQIAQR
jgi:hypothetical protein